MVLACCVINCGMKARIDSEIKLSKQLSYVKINHVKLKASISIVIKKIKEELKRKTKILSQKIKELQEEKLITRNKTIMEDLKNSKKKTKYFTGFENYDTLEVIFKHVENSLPVNFKGPMSSFDIFIMTFMKLRLDLPFTYLAFHSEISVKTVCKLFYNAIIAIHDKISCFVFWPDKEAMITNIPELFKQLFRVKPVFIIDCFEIFSEKPGNCLARSNTFSTCKHHQTIKYLICISCFGSIAFISKGFGRRCSDKFVFENCEILDFINVGDVILADRGFLIEESIKKKKARLIMPSFKNGSSQLEPIAIEKNRSIPA